MPESRIVLAPLGGLPFDVGAMGRSPKTASTHTPHSTYADLEGQPCSFQAPFGFLPFKLNAFRL